jgi:hypothetical protein
VPISNYWISLESLKGLLKEKAEENRHVISFWIAKL